MKTKLSHIIVTVILFFSSAIFLLFLCWWSWPYNPVTYTEPVLVLDKEVKAGTLVQYKVSYCKRSAAPAVVDRQFVDGIIYTVPSVKPNFPLGCHTKIQTVEVPPNLPPSDYKIRVYVSYQVNPIRTITVTYDTNYFKVTK